MDERTLVREIRMHLVRGDNVALERTLDGIVDLDRRDVHHHGRLLVIAILYRNFEGAAILIRHGASIDFVSPAYPHSIASTVLSAHPSDEMVQFLAMHQARDLWNLFAHELGPCVRQYLAWTPGNHNRWPAKTRSRISCLLVCLGRRGFPRTLAYYLLAFVASTPD